MSRGLEKTHGNKANIKRADAICVGSLQMFLNTKHYDAGKYDNRTDYLVKSEFFFKEKI